ncbi:hypothetical protein ARTHROSP310_28700 [Arthrobacter sp. AD-310]
MIPPAKPATVTKPSAAYMAATKDRVLVPSRNRAPAPDPVLWEKEQGPEKKSLVHGRWSYLRKGWAGVEDGSGAMGTRVPTRPPSAHRALTFGQPNLRAHRDQPRQQDPPASRGGAAKASCGFLEGRLQPV